MPILERKKPEADLRRSYVVNLEIGIIATLALLIALFRVNFNPEIELNFEEREQDIIDMEDIVQTEQIETPPPPPRPPSPVEVPNDEIIDDDFFDLDTDLDLDGPMDLPPPPPPPDDDDEPEIFMVVEDNPEPVGGVQEIYRNLRYPEIARRAGIEGVVVVQFVVDAQGNVQNPRILRGIGGGCDEAAIEAIKAVQWSPGRQRGRPVAVQFQVPIRFQLQN